MRIKIPKKGFEKLTEAKARLIAHLIGDGAHYKTKTDYVMKYEVRDMESLLQFHYDIFEVYGLEPSWWWNTSGITGKPIRFVRLRSKIVFEDLFRYSTYFSKDWKLKSPLIISSLKIKKEFLKALYDDEGSVVNKYRILLYSINMVGLLQVKEILKEFGIATRLESGFGCKKNVYALSLTDLKQFYKKIGFNLTRKQEKLEKFINQRKL